MNDTIEPMTEPSIYEKSAGGIVYRWRGSELEILMLAWKNAKEEMEYVLPKGKIETNEPMMDAAKREISEETGLAIRDLNVIKFLGKINYRFTAMHREDTPMIDKDVYLYLVKYMGKSEPRPRKEERFVGYKWFEWEHLQNTHLKQDVVGFIERNLHFM